MASKKAKIVDDKNIEVAQRKHCEKDAIVISFGAKKQIKEYRTHFV